jgi:tetratricopeptide (TPR) repeat protein
MRAFERGDYEAAISAWSQMAAQRLGAPDIPYYLGLAQLGRGSPTAAIAAFSEALTIDPDFGPAYLGRAQARLQQDPAARVDVDLAAAIANAPDFGDAYLARAAYRLGRGDPKGALADLSRAETLLPASPHLFALLAEAEYQQQNAEAAYQAVQQAVALDPTLLVAQRLRGVLALQLDQPQAALDALQIYTTYAPLEPAAQLLLGRAYLETGAAAAALKAIEPAAERQRELNAAELGELYLLRGQSNLARDDVETALEDLRAAFRYQPRRFAVAIAAAEVELRAGNFRQARQVLDAARLLMKQPQEKAAYYYWHGRALDEGGNPRGALVDWQALLDAPAGAAKAAWLSLARARLLAATPSVTPPAGASVTRTVRPPTASPTATATRTRAPVATRSATP